MADTSTAQPSLTLYHSFPFRSSRAAWVVNELGVGEQVQFKKISLHGKGSEEQRAEYQANVHPFGTIPALEIVRGDAKQVVLESGAICLFLADHFNGLLPPAEQKAVYYNWIVLCTATADSILEPLYMQLTHTPEEKRDKALIKAKKAQLKVFCGTLSSHLESASPWVCGETFTAADCVLGYTVWWASIIHGGVLVADYPQITAYLERLKARPGFQATFTRATKPSGGSV